MPRAQRTKSAVHEALQRRAGNRPGDGFSGLLGGGSKLNPPRVFANSRKYPTQESCTQSFAQRLRSRPRELWPTRSVRRATPPAALRRHEVASSADVAATYLIENAQLRFSERLCRHGRCRSRNRYPAYDSLNQRCSGVRLTAWALSCTARAHVFASSGAAVAAHTAGQQRENCNRRDTALVLFGRGASAPDRSRPCQLQRLVGRRLIGSCRTGPADL